MPFRNVKAFALISVAVLALAACTSGGQSSSKPQWKSYGFDGAGAQ